MARVEAGVGVDLVAIVAGVDALLNQPVTAAGVHAEVGARIGLGWVPVIAVFYARLRHAITAAS